MGKTQQAAGGGLTRADMAKLVPENIRYGVTLFAGTSKAVTGRLITLGDSIALDVMGLNFPMEKTVGVSTGHKNDSCSIENDFPVDFIGWSKIDFSYATVKGSSSATVTISFNITKDGEIVKTVSGGTTGTATIDISELDGMYGFRVIANVHYSGSSTSLLQSGVSITSIVLRR